MINVFKMISPSLYRITEPIFINSYFKDRSVILFATLYNMLNILESKKASKQASKKGRRGEGDRASKNKYKCEISTEWVRVRAYFALYLLHVNLKYNPNVDIEAKEN
ncbi:hypothetical protein [Desulfosporosinus hippei]|uniref:hypothetical protein n=1 Tax=Desulfosporosinus hippei TaxID=569859 RepID=UPI000B846902|nr:hypothetical protein [Desulfosporosinus hippei]